MQSSARSTRHTFFLSSTKPMDFDTQDRWEVNGKEEGVASDDLEVSLESLELLNISLSDDELLPTAPPLLFDKFLTMQEKRVVVTIQYSGESGFRPYFLTVAKKIKASHPDVIIERRILPPVVADANGGGAVFEVLVDGKVVVGKTRSRKPRERSVFVSMQELDVAVSRARRRRRPTTVYGEDVDLEKVADKAAVKVRLDLLRKNKRTAPPK